MKAFKSFGRQATLFRTRLALKFRSDSNFRLLLVSALAVPLVISFLLYSQTASSQTERARYQNDLAQTFINHEDAAIDPRLAAQQVRRSGHLSVRTQTHDFEIDLQPNDLRAPGYHAEEVFDEGMTRPVAMPPPATYKGTVSGMADSQARFTVNDQMLEGMILSSNGAYFVEPARKYSDAAAETDYLVYQDADVRSDKGKTCATFDEEIGSEANRLSLRDASAAPEVFSPFKVIEIATEADFEYVSAFGGSSAANTDILSIMNSVQAIYQRDLGLTFTVVFQHTWATANDPYNSTGDAVAALNEFTNYWNANFATQPRDLAHLWTGRDLGGPAGVAWTSVVCRDGTHSYGLSDLERSAPFRIGIPAHEIGHGVGASHPDGQAGCNDTIMQATLFPTNTLTFCPFSVNEITAFVNANSGCLSNAPATNPIDDSTFFVQQQYQDFLNRQADSSGLSFWLNALNSCGSDQICLLNERINVSASFFLSIEFQQTGYLVERIYKTAYADGTGSSTFGGSHQIAVPVIRFSEFLPDTQTIGQGVIVGQSGWEQQLEANKQNFANQFVQRSRFTSMYPTNTLPTTFVDTLNRNAGSPLSTTELVQLELEYTTGQKSRAQVLRQIAEHPNLVSSESNRAFVLMQYFGYLRRNPNDPPDGDYSGYDFWLTKLNQFNGNYQNAEMVKAFITSNEYRHRFGEAVGRRQ